MNKSENEQYRQMWDDRYKAPAYAYGKEPNVFFKECLEVFSPGSILMAADGEGRNGVFAAQLGWKVTSFDLSIEGKSKALALARERAVSLEYKIGELEQLALPEESFDAVGLIRAHVAADKKRAFHEQVQRYLKPGGIIILEAFSKKHLHFVNANPAVGGPRELGMLLSKEEVLSDFKSCDILHLEEREIMLNEGEYHRQRLSSTIYRRQTG